MEKLRFLEIKCLDEETGNFVHIEDTTKCNPHMVFYRADDVDARIAALEAENEILKQKELKRAICGLVNVEDLEEVISERDRIRSDYQSMALHHDSAHSDASRKKLENELVLANSLLDVIDQMLDGKEPDDFSESFPIIRKFADFQQELAAYRSKVRRMVEAANAYVDENGHYDYCRAIHGPPPETWLVESDCNCVLPKLKQAIAEVEREV